MASTDARPVPLKNTAFRFTFAIRKNDGTLITSWAGADSELSLDGAAFADATNEATEIGTSGVGYLDLTSGEMNADCVVLKTTVTNTDALPLVVTFFPEESADRAALVDEVWDEVLTGATHNVATSAGIRLRQVSSGIVTSGTAQAGSAASITLASAASSTDGTYDPAGVRLVGGTGAGQVRLILHYVGSTRIASVDRDWRTAPDNTSQYEIIAAPNLMSTNEGLAQGGASSTITLNANASAVDDTYKGQLCVIRTGTGQDQSRLIASYVGATKVATVVSPWTTTPNSGSAYMILPTGRAMMVTAEAGSITAASFATDAITATALAASAVTELQAGLATAADLTTLTGYVDTEIAAIKIKTDLIPASPAAVGDIPSAGTIADAVWDEAIAAHGAAGSTGEALSEAGGGGASAADIADAVWDEALAGHAAAGSAGEALGDAGSAGDPWATAVPGAYGAGTAGQILGSNLTVPTASLATAANLAVIDGVVDAILLDTAALDARVPASPAAAGDIPSADSIADALLDRANGIETALTLRQALRLVVAASAGKLSGAATTTVTIRNFGDTKSRIVASVDDAGNRTAVLTDVT